MEESQLDLNLLVELKKINDEISLFLQKTEQLKDQMEDILSIDYKGYQNQEIRSLIERGKLLQMEMQKEVIYPMEQKSRM